MAGATPDLIRALDEAIRQAAERAIRHAERMRDEAQRLLADADALEVRAKGLAVVVPSEVEAPAPEPEAPPSEPTPPPPPAPEPPPVPEPPPPEPEREEPLPPRAKPPREDYTLNRRSEYVTLAVADRAAGELGRFPREQFADKLALKPIQVGKWIARLLEGKKLAASETETGEVVYDYVGEAPAPEPEPTPEPAPAPPSEAPPAGVEPLREELRRLPAAQTSRVNAQTVAAAELQLAILKDVEAHDTVVVTEVAPRVGVKQGRVAEHLRALTEADLISRTGRNRRAEGQLVGRAGVEYRALVPSEAPPEPAPAPAHPGLEAVPEELRHVPAAHKGGPLAQRIEAAKRQAQILRDVQAHETVVAGETAERHGIDRHLVGHHLRELAEAGLIEPTGEHRRPAGSTRGPIPPEYRALKPRAPEPAPEVAPEPEPAPGGPTLEQVRDAVVKRRQRGEEPFTAAGLAVPNEWEPEIVVDRLTELTRMGLVEETSPAGGLTLYRCQAAATDPGAAARLDMERRKSERPDNDGGAAPVAGTGRQTIPNDKDVAQLVRDIRAAGGKADPAGSGHWEAIGKNGRRALIASTPRVPRTVKNDRARLKRLGIISS